MSQEQSNAQHGENNQKMTKKLVAVVVIMLAFGFAMVPLYDVICQITGWGLDKGLAVYVEQEPDTSREIEVQFLTITKNDMPWEFSAVQKSIKVHPGKEYEVVFKARNKSNRSLVGQAVPSFSPTLVAKYFNKTECFCFDQQTLAAGQEELMPMRFFVDKDLPVRYDTITLAYTLFNATPLVKESVSQLKAKELDATAGR